MILKPSNKGKNNREIKTSDTNVKVSKESNIQKPKQQKINKVLNPENPNAIPFSVVEAYKNIRVQLTDMLEKFNGKIIAISSPNASEGKSTTSLNIAITLSQLGKKVIILDADINRGTIHQKLKLPNDKGCMDILDGHVTYEQAVKHHSANFDVITCGKIANNSSELFDSVVFDNLLRTLKENYDYIVIDTPPVNLVSDALVIAKKSDGLIYVVRSMFTTYEAFKKAKFATDRLNVNTLGVIINAVDSNGGKYKYKYRYSKYGYGSYGRYGRYGYSGYDMPKR